MGNMHPTPPSCLYIHIHTPPPSSVCVCVYIYENRKNNRVQKFKKDKHFKQNKILENGFILTILDNLIHLHIYTIDRSACTSTKKKREKKNTK